MPGSGHMTIWVHRCFGSLVFLGIFCPLHVTHENQCAFNQDCFLIKLSEKIINTQHNVLQCPYTRHPHGYRICCIESGFRS